MSTDTKQPLLGNEFAETLKNDNVEVRTSRGVARNPVATVTAAVQSLIAMAVQARDIETNSRAVNAKFTAAVIQLRRLFWIDGRIDWNAKSQASRDAVKPLIEASRMAGESYDNAKWRLGKRVADALPAVVLSDVCKSMSVSLTDVQTAKVLDLFATAKGTKDETLMPVLAELRESLPTMTKARKASAEKAKTRNAPVQSESQDQTEKREARDIVAQFAQSVATVSMAESLDAALSAVLIAYATETGSGTKSYGDKGRGNVAQIVARIHAASEVLHKVLSDATVTPMELTLMGAMTGNPVTPETEPTAPTAPTRRKSPSRKRRDAKRAAVKRSTAKRQNVKRSTAKRQTVRK